MRTSPIIFQFEPERRPRRNASGDRLVTVTKLHGDNGHALPMIRLRGQWLRELGFAPGRRIVITAARKRLVITLDKAK